MTGRDRPAEERNYALWFFVLSMCLVLVTVWTVYDEAVTRRPWKVFQEEFRTLEMERLEDAQAAEQEKLDKPASKEKLEKIEEELAAAGERLDSDEYKEAKGDLADAESERREIHQEIIFLRSERDEAYYFWKLSVHQGKEDREQKENFEDLSLRVSTKEDDLKAVEEKVSASRQRAEQFTESTANLQAERDRITSETRMLVRLKDELLRKKPQIKQVLVPELGLVDRCATCHLAVDRPGFDGPEIPEPFRTHPDLEELLGKVHPVGRYGCTICHHGQGPQVKGVARRPFNHGRSDPYWERPLLEKPFTESTCRACHPDEWEIEFAPTLNFGRQVFADLACYACHLTPGFENGRRIGPSLNGLGNKTNSGWLVAWLENPRLLRPRTRMSKFWPEALDEEGRVRTGSEEEKTRSSEVRAIAAFLLDSSTGGTPDVSAKVLEGDPERGKALFINRGCFGCHRPTSLNLPPVESRDLFRDYGPDLSYIGSKVSKEWTASFLADPRAFFSETRMPNSELPPEEVADLAAFLSSLLREETFHVPAGLDSPELIEKGRELFTTFGCFGCHEIKGFENAVLVGPEMEGFGDKKPELLSFGDTVTDPKDQTWLRWTRTKLASPRLFRTEKIALIMSDNDLEPEEIEALAVFLMSLREEGVNPDYVRRLDGIETGEAAGARLVREYNCRGCHVLEDEGGDVRRVIRDPGLVPPDLTGEGAKVQPAWLYQFLKRPAVLRPWLGIKMPVFGFTDEQANIFVNYFMAGSGLTGLFDEVPVDMAPGLMDETTRVFVNLKCVQCHQLTVGPDLKYSDLAPDMALTRYRLRPQWMEDFILDPQAIQNGTKMPTYFPLEDDEDPDSMITPYPEWLGGDPGAQIKAVRDYLYLLESQDSLIVEER